MNASTWIKFKPSASRLTCGEKRFDLIINVVKLSVPIHVAAAFLSFTVGLQTVSQFPQAVSNGVRANRMTLSLQRLG